MQYIIRWKSKITGKQGGGTKAFDLKDAEEICHFLNLFAPHINHWPSVQQITAPDAATRRILTPGDVMLGTMLANGDLKPPRSSA